MPDHSFSRNDCVESTHGEFFVSDDACVEDSIGKSITELALSPRRMRSVSPSKFPELITRRTCLCTTRLGDGPDWHSSTVSMSPCRLGTPSVTTCPCCSSFLLRTSSLSPFIDTEEWPQTNSSAKTDEDRTTSSLSPTDAKLITLPESPIIPKQIPFKWSTHMPSKTPLPAPLMHPLVEAYIQALQEGSVTFHTIPYHDSCRQVAGKTFSMDLNGGLLVVESGEVRDSPVGYIWKHLCDSPIVIGITQAIAGDHNPHYHPQDECYYVVSGRGYTLCNGQYIELTQGDYFYIPDNTIHNTPILHPDGLSVLYWYPYHHHFNTFQYYWRASVEEYSPEATSAFDAVDEIRLAQLGLGRYGTNSTNM